MDWILVVFSKFLVFNIEIFKVFNWRFDFCFYFVVIVIYGIVDCKSDFLDIEWLKSVGVGILF